MVGLIIQCVLSLIPCIIGYYEAQKEFRKRFNEPKKEAKNVLIAIFVFALLSIVYQIYSYCQNQADKNKSISSFITLNKKNDNLEKQIINDNKQLNKHLDVSTIELSNQAAQKALIASQELQIAAKKLETDIKGTDKLPLISIAYLGGPSYSGVFINQSNHPLYLRYAISNYSQLCDCKMSKDKLLIDADCFNKNTIRQDITVNSHQNFIIDLPNYPQFIPNTKFVIQLFIQNKHFMVYYFVKEVAGKPLVYTRIYLTKNNKFSLYSEPGKIDPIIHKQRYEVDWDKEFYLPKNQVFGIEK